MQHISWGLTSNPMKTEKLAILWILLAGFAVAKDGQTVSRAEIPSGNPGVRAEEIAYLSDGLRINGYLPTPVAEGKHPGIIFNRGGNAQMNSLSRQSISRGHMAVLARAGYVVVASHYRQGGGSEGHGEFGGNDIHDVLNLIPLLEQEKSCDATRIGMLGASRGGMMTYITLTQTDRIRAAAVIGAMSDLPLNLESRAGMGEVYRTYIPDFDKQPEVLLKTRSAVNWAGKISKKTPLLAMQGLADWRVLPAEALEMADRLHHAKHPFRFVMFEGGQHGLNEHTAEVDRLLVNWFDDYLRDGKSWPSLDSHGW
jgi:dipeptidyl aminopeptidase/acylaminoacyl peptidase